MSEASDSTREIVNAMVARALARCEREGIAIKDFYSTLQSERVKHPVGTLPTLFNRVFERLASQRN